MTRHTESELWDSDVDDASEPRLRTCEVSGGAEQDECDETCEEGPTGNLADEALERSLRRTRRHLEERHRRTSARDLERVRAGLGLDDEPTDPGLDDAPAGLGLDDAPADPSADDSASAAGGGGGGGGDEAGEEEPRHVRNLERELHLAETKRKMGIDAPPVCVDNYVLERRLGGGGMGVVWRAKDPRIEQTVALKILRRTPARGQTVGLLALADNEGTAMAQVRHENVAIVHTVGDADGQPFIVMEYLAGQTLTKWVGEGEPSEPALLEAYAQIARGLQAVHDAEIVHGDFKPDNVIINDGGVPKVVDFGLAVKAGSGVLGGTPEYMALEQLDLEAPKTTYKSDQYALCVALFEDLVGSHPYVGQSYDQFAQTIRDSQPNISPGDIRKAFVTKISSNLRERQLHRPERLRRLPKWLQRALKRGLDPDPTRRFDSMEELALVLERPKRRARLRRTLKIVGGAALLGAAAVGSVAYAMQDDGPCAAPGAAFTEIWNESVVASLPAAVQGPAKKLLTPYMGRWTDARTKVCETRGEVSGAAHDARTTCLKRRLGSAELAIDSLQRGAADVPRVHELLKQAPPSSCLLHEEAIVVPPLGKANEVKQAYSDLETEVLAAELAENYEAAQTSADRLVSEAIVLDYDPLIAASLYHRGRVLLARSVNQALDARETDALRASGEHDLIESMKFAAASDSALSFDVAVFHMRYYGVVGRLFSDEDEKLFEVRFPTDHLDAVALATVKDARAIHNFHEALKLDGDEKLAAFDDVISLYEQALAVYRGGGDRFAEAKVLENLGNTLYHAGRPAKALDRLQKAEEIWIDIDGPWSTYLGSIYAAEIQVRDSIAPEDARRRCDEALLWIQKQPSSLNRAKVDLACVVPYWEDSARVSEHLLRAVACPLPPNEKLSALVMAAGLLLQPEQPSESELAEAEEVLQQTDDLEDAMNPDHALLINAYRGRLHLRRGEFSKAADRSAAAREQLEEQGPPTNHEAAQILLDLAEAHRGMNDPQDPELLEEADSYIKKIDDDDPEDSDLPALRQRLADLQRPTPESNPATPQINHGR